MKTSQYGSHTASETKPRLIAKWTHMIIAVMWYVQQGLID